MATTLDQIAEMAGVYLSARKTFGTHHGTKPQPFDLENEDHIRWHIQNEKLVGAVVRLEGRYRAACDEFFAKSCPDLIQLLVDVDEYFDGQEDADDGIPNTAMKVRMQIEALLGPVPAPKPEPEANFAFSGSF